MTLFLSLSLSHIKSRILSLSLFPSPPTSIQMSDLQKAAFSWRQQAFGKKLSCSIIFSHKHTSSHKASQSYKTHTIFLSLSLVSLCRTPSSRLTYISLSLSLSLSVSFSSRHQSLNLSLSFIRNDCINSSKTIFLLTLKTQTKTQTTTLSLWLPLVLLFLQQFLEK